MTLLYIKVRANLVVDDFILIPMAHHSHKLVNTTLEEDTCGLLCMDLLFVFDNTNCFSLNMEEISFMLAPKILETEQNLELQT